MTPLSVYDLSIPVFITSLKALKGLLDKAKDYSEAKKIDFSVLLATRLFPNQFPLSKQIQITCDTAKFFVTRLTAVSAPSHPDTEATYEEFQDRIRSVIQVLESVKPEDFQGWETKTQAFRWSPGKELDAKTYVTQYAIPNFFFHLTTAYSILRAAGLDLGKADYLGQIDWKSTNA